MGRRCNPFGVRRGSPGKGRTVSRRTSQVFDVVAYLVAVRDAVQEFQELNEHPDSILLLRAPGDAGVGDSRPMQGQKINETMTRSSDVAKAS
jgi:hypothetical protein